MNTIKAIEYSKQLFNEYFCNCNLDVLEKQTPDDFNMFGLDLLFNYKKKSEITEYLEHLKSHKSVFYSILEEEYFPFEIGQEIGVMSQVKLQEKDTSNTIVLRGSLIFQTKNDDTVELKHFHLSTPYYHNSFLFESKFKEDMENAEEFFRIVPGGLVRLANNDEFTILDANENFCNRVFNGKENFTKGELSFISLIHASDKAEVISSLKNNLSVSETLNLKFRMFNADKSTVWVMSNFILKDKFKTDDSIYCVIMDVTKDHLTQVELSLKKEKYRIISEISQDINFEYDAETDTLECEGDLSRLNIPATIKNFHTVVFEMGLIYEDDQFIFTDLFEKIKNGLTDNWSSEVRFYDNSGEIVWYCIKLKKHYFKELDAVGIFGNLVDIDGQKKETEKLILSASLDPLTKLLNKTSTHKNISEYLRTYESTASGALLVIDLDNFKTVNDNMGHLFGDVVIKEMALKLRVLFRNSDIIGRIGGDEFVVFMKEIYDDEIVFAKARKICEGVELNYENDKIQVTASVGIALSSNKLNNFNKLFKAADTALYFSKSQGKKQYKMFNNTILRKDIKLKERVATVGPLVSSTYDDTCIKLFELLYESDDISKDMNYALDIMLNFFEVSRIYICVINSQKKCLYQVCRNNIKSSVDVLNTEILPFTKDLLSAFNSEGIFYCVDTSTLETPLKGIMQSIGVQSSLQYMITFRENKRIIFGIDDCVNKRPWKKNEIDALVIMSKVLNEFIMSRLS